MPRKQEPPHPGSILGRLEQVQTRMFALYEREARKRAAGVELYDALADLAVSAQVAIDMMEWDDRPATKKMLLESIAKADATMQAIEK